MGFDNFLHAANPSIKQIKLKIWVPFALKYLSIFVLRTRHLQSSIINRWNNQLVEEETPNSLSILEQFKKNELKFLEANRILGNGGNVALWKPTMTVCQTSHRTGHYVGLANQGLTCYINSLIQQFFMTPHFRQGLLEAVVDEEKLIKLKNCEQLSKLL
jgi:hypothetical protein